MIDMRCELLPGRASRVVGQVSLALAACLAGWQGWQGWHDAVALAEKRDQLTSLNQREGRQRPAALPMATLVRHQQVDQLSRYLATPWAQLLGIFEAHASRHKVVLVRMEPNAEHGHIELGGHAANVEAISAYLIALEREPLLQDVMLTHHEASEAGAAAGIDFTLSASWRHAALDSASPMPVKAASQAAASAEREVLR